MIAAPTANPGWTRPQACIAIMMKRGGRCISTRTTSPRSWSVEAQATKGLPGAALVIVFMPSGAPQAADLPANSWGSGSGELASRLTGEPCFHHGAGLHHHHLLSTDKRLQVVGDRQIAGLRPVAVEQLAILRMPP